MRARSSTLFGKIRLLPSLAAPARRLALSVLWDGDDSKELPLV